MTPMLVCNVIKSLTVKRGASVNSRQTFGRQDTSAKT